MARISHGCVMYLLCALSLLRRIGVRCMEVLSSTDCRLCSVDRLQLKPHRLKAVLRDRAGPAA